MDDIQSELLIRLSGVKDDDGIDDMLITNALNLKEDEF